MEFFVKYRVTPSPFKELVIPEGDPGSSSGVCRVCSNNVTWNFKSHSVLQKIVCVHFMTDKTVRNSCLWAVYSVEEFVLPDV